jgi:hypothetical protein
MAPSPLPVVFPPELMREQSVMWRIGASTAIGGQSAVGAFQVIRLDGGGLWVAELRNISIVTASHVRQFRAIAALAENGVMPLLVPRCERRTMPAHTSDGTLIKPYGDIPHSDGALFSDGSGYYQPVVVASVYAGAALRATTMTIKLDVGGPLLGGEIFAIEHRNQSWRMYEIKTAVAAGPNTVITFRPPLREAVTAGDLVEFDIPRCVMRLSTPDAMTLELDLRRFGTPSVSFTEYFYPT